MSTPLHRSSDTLHPLATSAAVTTAVYTRGKVDAAIDRWRKVQLARAAEVKVKGPRHRAG